MRALGQPQSAPALLLLGCAAGDLGPAAHYENSAARGPPDAFQALPCRQMHFHTLLPACCCTHAGNFPFFSPSLTFWNSSFTLPSRSPLTVYCHNTGRRSLLLPFIRIVCPASSHFLIQFP